MRRLLAISTLAILGAALALAGPAASPAENEQYAQISIQTPVRDISVYIDGLFVGRTDRAEAFSVAPGGHRVELRSANGLTRYETRINAAPGQPVFIRPPADLASESQASGGLIVNMPAMTNAKVLFDGAYVGVAGEMKTLSIPAGTHTVEVQAPNGDSVEQTVSVQPSENVSVVFN